MWYWYEQYLLGLMGFFIGYVINVILLKTEFWKRIGIFK